MRPLCFLLAFGAAAALGAGAIRAESARAPATDSVMRVADAGREPRVSLDFRKAEIGDVLRLLAKQYDLNIVLSKAVTGPISIRLHEVTVDEALESIITINGFFYSRRGPVIRVTTAAAEQEEGGLTRVFRLRHAGARGLLEPVQSVMSSAGTIQADERSNSLIVTDRPAVLSALAQVLDSLDTPTPQVLIETKIIETVLSDEERLGLDWQIAASLQGSAVPTTFPIPQGTSSTPVFNQFKPQGQTSAESTTTNTATGATATATSTAFPAGTEGLMGRFPFVSGGLFTFGTMSFSQLKVVLQALESRGSTKALAVPSITTLDNQEAQIVIGTNVPVPTFARNKLTGEFEITGYTDRKTGVVLRVTPHVSEEGRIRLDIHPEVSNIVRFVGDPRAQVPVTSTREADTQVSLRSGETVAIGGLMEERDIANTRAVPVLGKVPFLGRLFRFEEKTKSRTDLFIFITAHVMTDEQRVVKTLEALEGTGQPELFDPSVRPPQPVKRPKRRGLRFEGRQLVIPEEGSANGS